MTYSFEEYSKLFQAVKEVRTSEAMKYDVGSNEYDKAAAVREVVHLARAASRFWRVDAHDEVGCYSHVIQDGVQATGEGIRIVVDTVMPVSGVVACMDNKKYLFGKGRTVFDIELVNEKPEEIVIHITGRREEHDKRGQTLRQKVNAGLVLSQSQTFKLRKQLFKCCSS